MSIGVLIQAFSGSTFCQDPSHEQTTWPDRGRSSRENGMAAACFEVTGLYAQRCVVYILKDILEKANSRLGANKWDPNPLTAAVISSKVCWASGRYVISLLSRSNTEIEKTSPSLAIRVLRWSMIGFYTTGPVVRDSGDASSAILTPTDEGWVATAPNTTRILRWEGSIGDLSGQHERGVCHGLLHLLMASQSLRRLEVVSVNDFSPHWVTITRMKDFPKLEPRQDATKWSVFFSIYISVLFLLFHHRHGALKTSSNPFPCK